MFSAVRALRLLPRRIAIARAPAASSIRRLHVTPRLQAAESGDNFITAMQDSPLFRKIADKPEVLKAMMDAAKVMQAKGLDLTSGQRPSMMAMMKLAGDAELKEAITNVKSAMDKAGVELSAQEIMEMYKNKP